MTSFDARLTPARPDLAATHLKGRIDAPRYVEGRATQVREPVIDLRKAPDPARGAETQLLFGERFVVYDEEEGWAWGQCARDGYVGYVSASALASPAQAPNHRVSALRTHLYAAPDIKTPPLAALTFDACVHVSDASGRWAKTPQGFLHAAHLSPLETRADDPVAVAEMFVRVPYLWGGRSSQGLDCSALVQTALRAAGHAAPRDSDMLAAFGEALPLDAAMAHLKRGDLVFWKGHVGIMRDAATLLHANAFHMSVVSEPLSEARARIAASEGGAMTGARRV